MRPEVPEDFPAVKWLEVSEEFPVEKRLEVHQVSLSQLVQLEVDYYYIYHWLDQRREPWRQTLRTPFSSASEGSETQQ